MSHHQSTQHVPSGIQESKEAIAQRWDQAQEMVTQRPMASVGLCFGLGFGAGMLLAALFGGIAPARRENGMERVGRNVLDAIRRAIPEEMGDWSGWKGSWKS